MREPSNAELATIVGTVVLGDEDAVYESIAQIGLPDEVASRWYAFLVEHPSCNCTGIARQLLMKAWQ